MKIILYKICAAHVCIRVFVRNHRKYKENNGGKDELSIFK